MSMGAGFAAGIGAGIAIGISSGQKQGQQKVCDYLEANQIALFDQEGKHVTIESLRKDTGCGSCNRKSSKAMVMFSLLLVVAIAGIALYFVLR